MGRTCELSADGGAWEAREVLRGGLSRGGLEDAPKGVDPPAAPKAGVVDAPKPPKAGVEAGAPKAGELDPNAFWAAGCPNGFAAAGAAPKGLAAGCAGAPNGLAAPPKADCGAAPKGLALCAGAPKGVAAAPKRPPCWVPAAAPKGAAVVVCEKGLLAPPKGDGVAGWAPNTLEPPPKPDAGAAGATVPCAGKKHAHRERRQESPKNSQPPQPTPQRPNPTRFARGRCGSIAPGDAPCSP